MSAPQRSRLASPRAYPLFQALSLALWLSGSALVAQAEGAKVIGLQMPAWLEREGWRRPLQVGSVLDARDQIITGAQARVLLAMDDGSQVKLGEKAQLNLRELQPAPRSGVFRAALDVLQGAFRYTTNTLAKAHQERDIDIRIATVTAGIRGTDVWGKAAADKDIVCLLEGKIAVRHTTADGQAEPAFIMDQPMSFYIAPRTAPAQPVGPVPPEKLAVWAQETELQWGQGIVKEHGAWQVHVGLPQTKTGALKLYDQLHRAGYAAKLQPLTGAGRRYQVRLLGLNSAGEAEALAEQLRDQGFDTQSLANPKP